MEGFHKSIIDVESPEFVSEFRQKIARRLRDGYPLEEADVSSLPSQVEESGVKFSSNSWVGDAFAHVIGLYRLKQEDVEKLRKIILTD